jgi:hypothetical protein
MQTYFVSPLPSYIPSVLPTSLPFHPHTSRNTTWQVDNTHTNTIFLSGRAHLFITPEDMQSLLSFDFPLGSTNW